MRRTIYRDTETGRFAKKSTWKRSKAHGGTRYKKQIVEIPPPPPPEDEYEEWAITFEYP